MFVQIITYQIDPVSDADFNDGNREFAEMMTQQPGLLTKVWLKADEPGSYGGVYLWRDRESCEAFLASPLARRRQGRRLGAQPHVAGSTRSTRR